MTNTISQLHPLIRWPLLCLCVLAACTPADEPLPTLAQLPDQEANAQQAAAAPTLPDDLAALPVGILAFWEPAVGQLSPQAPQAVWRFVGEAGAPITLHTTGDLPIEISLLSPTGAELAGGEVIQTTLPDGGIYTVVLTLRGEVSGAYTLLLRYSDRPGPGEETPTPLPQVVGIPTPTPPLAGDGLFIGRIQLGEAVGGILAKEERAHLYTFEGQAGDIVRIHLQRISETLDPFVILYSPDGQPIAMDDDSGDNESALLRFIRLPEDGLYIVRVGGAVEGSYTLSVQPLSEEALATPTRSATLTPTPTIAAVTPTFSPAIPGNRVEDHKPIIGVLAEVGDFARYPFFAAAGEVVSIGVTPSEGSALLPKIELYDPDGVLIAETTADSQAGNAAVLSAVALPSTGPYMIFVFGEGDTSGEYVLSYGIGTTRQNVMRGEAFVDRPNEGAIAAPALRDVWGVFFSEGDVITVAASPIDATLDPVIEVASAGGEVVASDDNSGGGANAQIEQVRIPASGLYHLRVRDARGTGVGRYTLIWRYINRAPTPTPPPIPLTILSVEDFAPEGQYMFYPFQGAAGQLVQIRVIGLPEGGLDPVVTLIAPDGRPLADADDSDGTLNPRLIVELPQDGTYTVRVNGYLSSGPFQLIVEVLY